MTAYAETAAQLWCNHWIERNDGGRDRRANTALARFMRQPNAYQTRSDFMLNLVRALKSRGNAYAFAIRNDRFEIAEMHLLGPDTEPIVDRDTGEVFYRLGTNALLMRELEGAIAPARDVLHIRLHAPRHPLLGESPVSAAVAAIAANEAISNHQATFYSNMSRPSGVLVTEQKLTAEQTRELRTRWEEMSAGMSSGRVPILSSGVKWEQMGLSANDAQMIGAFRMSVEDISRAFRVPLPLVNVMEGATFSNTEHLMRFWLASGLGFMLEHIELSFDRMFGLGPREYCEFDTKALLRTDFAARMNALGEAVTKGIYSPNEARAEEGLEAVDGGDSPRIQQQMIPLDAPVAVEPPSPSAPPPPALPAPSPEPAPAPAEVEEGWDREDLLTHLAGVVHAGR